MIKEAWSEPTKVNDAETGKPIYVSTSARVAFRKAFPAANKVRNPILNIAIATIFSSSKTSQTFRPKSDHFNYAQGQSGMIRPAGGGRFVAIVGSSWVKIITFKGAPPQLDLPAPTSSPADPSGAYKGNDPLMTNPSPSGSPPAEEEHPIANMFPGG